MKGTEKILYVHAMVVGQSLMVAGVWREGSLEHKMPKGFRIPLMF
jgi:hypothetical protein